MIYVLHFNRPTECLVQAVATRGTVPSGPAGGVGWGDGGVDGDYEAYDDEARLLVEVGIDFEHVWSKALSGDLADVADRRQLFGES